MQEETLYFFWQMLAVSRQTVRLQDHQLQVLAAGQLNRQRGPDFTAARFLLDGIIYQGDVECHVRSSDWYGHLHHIDPAFSRVLLHLTLLADRIPVEHRLSGMQIPTVTVPESLLRAVLGQLKSSLFTVCPVTSAKVDLLKTLALRRLHTKARIFLTECNVSSWPQLFYVYFFRALGYSANRDPFQQLAHRLPWVRLKSWLQERYLPFDILYALYAGQAGFLASVADPDSYTIRLQQQYRQWGSVEDTPPIAEGLWQWAGQRRGNHPHFRLAGGLAFFREYGSSVFEQCLEKAGQRREFDVLYAAWKEFLSIPCRGYWQNHLALGVSIKSARNRFYFGLSRQQEIIMNVFIPLLLARAWLKGSFGFAQYLQAFYLWIPAVNSYSSLSTWFPWHKKMLKLWPAQALYQGLLQLQNVPFSLREENPVANSQELLPSIDTDSENSYNLDTG